MNSSLPSASVINKGNGVTDIAQCVLDDRKDKIAKAKMKTHTDDAKKCNGNDKDGVPKRPDFGVTDPNTVNQAAMQKEMALLEVLYGSDLDGAIDEATNKDAAKCQEAVAKALKKCQDTKLKEYNKCKQGALKQGNRTLVGCVLLDVKDKIEKKCNLDDEGKVDNVRKTLDKKCVGRGVLLSTAFPHCLTNMPDLRGRLLRGLLAERFEVELTGKFR